MGSIKGNSADKPRHSITPQPAKLRTKLVILRASPQSDFYYSETKIDGFFGWHWQLACQWKGFIDRTGNKLPVAPESLSIWRFRERNPSTFVSEVHLLGGRGS